MSLENTKRRRFLKAVATKFPDAPAIADDLEEASSSLTWQRGDLLLGVAADEDGGWIFFGSASRDTNSVDEVVSALQAMFDDELVQVVVYFKGDVVFVDIARHDDPTNGFDQMGRRPDIDQIEIRSWNGSSDFDSAHPPSDDGD